MAINIGEIIGNIKNETQNRIYKSIQHHPNRKRDEQLNESTKWVQK